MSDKDDHKILTALAGALVNKPRSSLQELAAAVGISKATLHRFCGTREQLIERLLNYGVTLIDANIKNAQLDTAPPLEALRTLTAYTIENPEISTFMVHYWELDWEAGKDFSNTWDRVMDAFFLRGQQQGLFRIDIPAAALTELWVSIVLGMLEAQHRGRVAKSGILTVIEQAFLNGVSQKPNTAL